MYKTINNKQTMKRHVDAKKMMQLFLISWAIYICFCAFFYIFKSAKAYIVESSLIQSYKKGELNKSQLESALNTVHSVYLSDMELKERLGRSTWTLLHTMAARYPAFPTDEHKKDTLNFIMLLAKLYPCGDCAVHFQKLLKSFPPKVGSHDDFKNWMCNAHNIVNQRLGKPIFDCSTVDEVWKCGCSA